LLTTRPRRQTRKLQAWIACTLVGVFYSYEYILRIAPNLSVPELMSSFSISAGSVGILASFFYYAYTPLQIPVGFLIDRFGSRNMLTLAAFLCASGVYIFGATDHLLISGFGRFWVGFGSAFAFVGMLRLFAKWVPPRHFALMCGIAMTLGTLGAGLGNLIMGWLVERYSWKTLCSVLSGIGFLLLPLFYFFVRDPKPSHSSLSPTSTDFQHFSSFIKELKELIQNRQAWLNVLIGCFLYLPTSVFIELWGHSCIMCLHNTSHSATAFAISLTFLGWAVGAPLFGFLSDKIGRRVIFLRIASIISFILLGIILYVPSISPSSLYIFLFSFGLSSSPQALIYVITKEHCKPTVLATAFAFNNFIIMLGGLIVQPLVGSLLDLSLETATRTPNYPPESYQSALSILPLGLVLAGVLTFFLKDKKNNQTL
jgi:MFS family permease